MVSDVEDKSFIVKAISSKPSFYAWELLVNWMRAVAGYRHNGQRLVAVYEKTIHVMQQAFNEVAPIWNSNNVVLHLD